ncbi:MAG TPA: tRNA preQ1(34) S-adenosylmethionine ribosyltransferase-isomerase QueA [Firmicutes bacterium]|jgi:S-adenosylmethionine:tRNA ribosyltransferase-isomerase|nr:tRNA preQ1(34) S-adenosylmethionine ribosyltransferase-isomerase QueA [Bacillota bacterium]
MRVDDFDYELPERLIAQAPLAARDASRLMVLVRDERRIEHRHFGDLPSYLSPGDVLVLNDTRVIPARLRATRPTGGRVEILLLQPRGGDVWECLARPGRRAQVGQTLTFADGRMIGHVLSKTEYGGRVVEFRATEGETVDAVVDAIGEMPVPHYIKRRLEQSERYQTVYARERGSAAAPTAGLHFTPELLGQIERAGVAIARVTLHVGLGTFRPVKTERVEEHVMHAEHYEVSEATADVINSARSAGGRVVAVGTTTVRTLESAAGVDGRVMPGSGWTSIFIYPGYTFRAVDAMVTNLHLPKSTLIMMVSAFAGRDFVFDAYRRAVQEEYRFFSFGDAMLILNQQG